MRFVSIICTKQVCHGRKTEAEGGILHAGIKVFMMRGSMISFMHVHSCI